MGVFLHQNGFEPPLKQMAHSRMSPIVVLRIAAVELPHAQREIRLRRFDEEMIVIVHQAVGMAQPAVAIDDVGQNREPLGAVAVVGHDILPGIAPAGDMVDGAGYLNAEWTSHGRECSLRECSIARPDPVFAEKWSTIGCAYHLVMII